MTTNQTVLSVVDYNIKNIHLLSWAERFQCGKSSRVLRAPLLRLCNEKRIATCRELCYWLCAKRYCLLSELNKGGKYSLTATLLGINNSNLLTVKFSQVGPFILVLKISLTISRLRGNFRSLNNLGMWIFLNNCSYRFPNEDRPVGWGGGGVEGVRLLSLLPLKIFENDSCTIKLWGKIKTAENVATSVR